MTDLIANWIQCDYNVLTLKYKTDEVPRCKSVGTKEKKKNYRNLSSLFESMYFLLLSIKELNMFNEKQ